MKEKGKKSKWFYRAKDELERIRKALELAKTQRDKLTLTIAELKTIERQFIYLIEEVEESLGGTDGIRK